MKKLNDKALEISHSKLTFFGRVTAGLTHEIKNGLAIIKEETGLVLDLIKMIQKGHQADFDRMASELDKVQKRIGVTDEIVKDLNRFSHSVDQVEQVFDLSELLALMVKLVNRFARMHNVEIKITKASEQIQIQNNFFMVEQILFIFIEEAIKSAGKGGKVQIAVEQTPGFGSYVLCGSWERALEPFQSDRELFDYFLKISNCKIIFHEKDSKTILSFPIINDS